MTDRVLRLAETHSCCTVLGPGRRFVVWVQGCPLDCRGCTSPQWIPTAGGRDMEVSEVAAMVVESGADGLTLSGGEPFAQAAPLADLIDSLRTRRDLSVLSYSGYTLEHLRAHGNPEQRRLLSRLDILVDGPYLINRHADLRWRGSANQRIHYLSPRHAPEADDTGAGIQFDVDAEGCVRWAGVPAVPGFRARFEQQLLQLEQPRHDQEAN